MSQGKNPAQESQNVDSGSGGVLALEQGSLSGCESRGKACHLATLRSLSCLFWEGAGGRISRITGRGSLRKDYILPSIKRKQFVY